MKSKCIDGRPHIWHCFVENGIEYQVCKRKGCQAIRAHKIENKWELRFGQGEGDGYEREGFTAYLEN